MILTWANPSRTLVSIDDGKQVQTMPADPANPFWAALAARVAAGELVVADYVAPAAQPPSSPT